MKEKYYKRHYATDIRKNKIETGFDCETLFNYSDSGNYSPSESIEITKKERSEPLPAAEFTKIDRNTYHIEYWHYESEPIKEDEFVESIILARDDSVVTWDDDEDKYVLSTPYPDFSNVDVDTIAYDLLKIHKDDIMRDAKELAEDWNINLAEVDGLDEAFVYTLPGWNYVDVNEIEEKFDLTDIKNIRFYTFKLYVRNAFKDAAIKLIKEETKE